MRLLHTSDWHVGKTVAGRSRAEEFDAVFEEIVGIAEQEKVDAVLVSGDLYDQRAPTPEADELVFSALVRLAEAGIRVVTIPGNHESPMRLKAFAPLFAKIGVAMVFEVRRPDQGGVIEVPSRSGDEAALIVAVPFVPERRFVSATATFEASENWYLSYADGMGKLLEAMTSDLPADRISVVMAHLFTDGALLGGGERDISGAVGYALPPSRLPATVNYVALGHVHLAQTIKGAPAPARYSGSVLQLDFGEPLQSKSLFVVEAAAGKPAQINEFKLSAGRHLITVSGTIEELTAQKDAFGDAYLRTYVKTDAPVPGLADRVREALPNAVYVHPEYPKKEPDAPTMTPSSLGPHEQFDLYYRTVHKADPDPDLVAAFDEVLTLEQEQS